MAETKNDNNKKMKDKKVKGGLLSARVSHSGTSLTNISAKQQSQRAIHVLIIIIITILILGIYPHYPHFCGGAQGGNNSMRGAEGGLHNCYIADKKL